MANRIFIDMDGVIVDFDRFRDERGLTGDQVKRMKGAYLSMPAIPGAVEAVRSLIGMGYEVWLATKPPTGIPHAYSDKAAWVMEHLPELKRRIIITHDKGLLGDAGDYLCDDRPHKANCEKFSGTLLRFVDGYHWPQALDFFRENRGKNHRHSGGDGEDSARLDWLCSGRQKKVERTLSDGWYRVYQDMASIMDPEDWHAMTDQFYETTREAIDAARAGERGVSGG